MTETGLRDWIALGISVLVLAGYQIWLHMIGRKRPERVARMAHGQIRSAWAEALAKQPGSEILAVQTLRNSLMSSSVSRNTSSEYPTFATACILKRYV